MTTWLSPLHDAVMHAAEMKRKREAMAEGREVLHLCCNRRGRYGRAACDQTKGGIFARGYTGKGALLVETIGAVTCEACQRFVLSIYGEKRAGHLYPGLKERT